MEKERRRVALKPTSEDQIYSKKKANHNTGKKKKELEVSSQGFRNNIVLNFPLLAFQMLTSSKTKHFRKLKI